MRDKTVADILQKIDYQGRDECWGWLGSHDVNGRPQHGTGRDGISTMVSHRVLMIFTARPPMADEEAHHTCETHWCVNPWHLVPMLRAGHRQLHRKAPVACPKGHPYTPENTGWQTKDGYQRRYCKQCNRERAAKWKARQTAESPHERKDTLQ